jgi:hypothetical protein
MCDIIIDEYEFLEQNKTEAAKILANQKKERDEYSDANGVTGYLKKIRMFMNKVKYSYLGKT